MGLADLLQRKKPASSVNAPPFHPLATPPMGSAGDAWDGLIALPPIHPNAEPGEAAPAGAKKHRRKPKRLYSSIRPKLVMAVPIGWVGVALAGTSVGPGSWLVPLWLAIAATCAVVGMIQLDRQPFVRGAPHLIAIAAAAAMIGVRWALW